MKNINLLLCCFVLFSLKTAKAGAPYNGYRGYVDFAVGEAYNLNTAQKISTNNMQLFNVFSTTHGYVLNKWFVGAGIGYYHSFRDKENMYPIYAAGRYTFENTRMKPYIETRVGIVYDPRWIQTVQAYGSLSAGLKVYKGLQVGLRAIVYRRPNRFFTANAAVVIGYAFGK